MGVIITVGTFFGDYLDNKNHTETPIYTISFSLLSIFFALYYAQCELSDGKKILVKNFMQNFGLGALVESI